MSAHQENQSNGRLTMIKVAVSITVVIMAIGALIAWLSGEIRLN